MAEQFHNISFRDFVKTLIPSDYVFSIDKDDENDVVELSIHSTSMSELDGSEEGELGSFSYLDTLEIYEDIALAIKIRQITLTEI
jgi:hypothetical protein